MTALEDMEHILSRALESCKEAEDAVRRGCPYASKVDGIIAGIPDEAAREARAALDAYARAWEYFEEVGNIIFEAHRHAINRLADEKCNTSEPTS